MKLALSTCLGMLVSLAAAGDGFLGTKATQVAGPMQAEGGSGFMPFLQMMIALGIVLALLKFVMPQMVTKLNKKIITKVGSQIQIEESAVFAGGSLYVVKARSKVLLLSVTSTGVSCLSDLTPSEPEPQLPTFQELVEKEQSGPLQPFAVVEATDAAMPDAAAALERLKKLAG